MKTEERGVKDQGLGGRAAVQVPTPTPQPPTPVSQTSYLVPRTSYLRPAGAALGSFLATRMVVGLASWLGVTQLIAANPAYNKGPFTEAALLWDSAWYMSIVKDGYALPPPPATSNLAFPPLLPLLTRLLGDLFQGVGLHLADPVYGNWAVAGILISNGALLLGLFVLWHLVALDHPAPVADRTVWFVAAFPLGIFWSAFYTESLFLLLIVSSVLAARRNRWPLAGLLGGLAVLTRWAGLMLIVVLFVEWLTARRRVALADGNGAGVAVPRPAWLSLAWLGGIPLALVGYMGYLQAAFGTPWGVFQSQSAGWQHGLSFFLTTYWDGVDLLWQSLTQTGPRSDVVLHLGYGNSIYMWLDLGLPLLYVALGAIGWRQGWLRPSDLVWLALGLLFPLSLGTTISLARYLMPLWPALIVVARLCVTRPNLDRAWLVASTGLLALGAYLYANAKWIG